MSSITSVTDKESQIVMVTLKDGSQASLGTVNVIYTKLKTLREQFFLSLFDLVQLCKNASEEYAIDCRTGEFVKGHYQGIPKSEIPMAPNSEQTLRGFHVIDQNGKIDKVVQRIVLNSVEGDGFSLKVVSPLKTERVSKVESKNDPKT